MARCGSRPCRRQLWHTQPPAPFTCTDRLDHLIPLSHAGLLSCLVSTGWPCSIVHLIHTRRNTFANTRNLEGTGHSVLAATHACCHCDASELGACAVKGTSATAARQHRDQWTDDEQDKRALWKRALMYTAAVSQSVQHSLAARVAAHACKMIWTEHSKQAGMRHISLLNSERTHRDCRQKGHLETEAAAVGY